MTEFTAYLRGTNFRPPEARALVADLPVGAVLTLQREPGNAFDENAIMVLDPESQMHLGYVAKEIAVELAPMIDEGRAFVCTVETNMMKSVILNITDTPEDLVYPGDPQEV